jgi:hypothetical protein
MAEDKFLAFKGLKQYDPDSGWASVEPAPHSRAVQEQDFVGLDQDPHELSGDKNSYLDPYLDTDLGADLEGQLDIDDPQSGQQDHTNPNISSRLSPNSSPEHNPSKDELNLNDPLLSELFDQLHQPPQDELTQSWKIIATSVNILSQRMAQRRDLSDRLKKLDIELDNLRSNILSDLEDIQRSADQQLSMARLRAEVSTLAQARLASRLRQKSS